jgi:hypothetical protein
MAPSDTSETTPATAKAVRDRPNSEAVRDAQTADRSEPVAPPPRVPDVGREGNNGSVELARIAWLVTVLACLVTIAILTLEGYYGYALVTLAVAVSAGINLT